MLVQDIEIRTKITKMADKYCRNERKVKMINNACTFIASSLNNFSFGYDFENSQCIYLVSQLQNYIANLYNKGVRNFYSVCEQGVDLWAAEYVAGLIKKDNSVKLSCILPYEEQAAKWYPDIRELYYRVLEQASDTKYIGLHYSDDCIKKARLFTIDHCSHIFTAIESGYDKEYADYALEGSKDVYNCFSNIKSI